MHSQYTNMHPMLENMAPSPSLNPDIRSDKMCCMLQPALPGRHQGSRLGRDVPAVATSLTSDHGDHADRHCVRRYLDAEIRATLSSDQNFHWCPSGSCNFGQLQFDGDIFTCQACSYKACMSCKGPWHGGETCGDYQARKVEECVPNEMAVSEGSGNGKRGVNRTRDLEEYEAKRTLERVAKLCPGCGRRVQKDG